MRDHDDDVPYIVIERSGSGLIPFVWGALMGAAAALLLAPKSGVETQRELKERAQRLRKRAEEKVGELQESLHDALDQGREQLGGKLKTAKRSVGEGRTKAQQAFEAGKNAARAARSEFEERISAKPDDGDEVSAS